MRYIYTGIDYPVIRGNVVTITGFIGGGAMMSPQGETGSDGRVEVVPIAAVLPGEAYVVWARDLAPLGYDPFVEYRLCA